jgi:hypothetical protein
VRKRYIVGKPWIARGVMERRRGKRENKREEKRREAS